MNDQPQHPRVPLQIQKPCPKSWAELRGDGARRFCSQCSLHVHDAGQLTQSEARALVSEASARVCMRIQYDPRGVPIFRDSEPAPGVGNTATPRVGKRLARWALSAAAGVLAACHGSLSSTPAADPAACSNGGQPPSKMGKVVATELLGVVLGDVEVPAGFELLGEAAPEPVSALTPEASPTLDGK